MRRAQALALAACGRQGVIRNSKDWYAAMSYDDGYDIQQDRRPPTVSALLREARERQGYDLRDVAATLRIRLVYLRAIEAGRYSELPGSAYAVGFIRSLAEHLGLEPEAVVRQFKAEMAGQARQTELYFPTPVPEGRIPGGALLLGAVILAGIAYGGWYYLSSTDRSIVDLVPALPERLTGLVDAFSFGSSTPPKLEDVARPGGESGGEAGSAGAGLTGGFPAHENKPAGPADPAHPPANAAVSHAPAHPGEHPPTGAASPLLAGGESGLPSGVPPLKEVTLPVAETPPAPVSSGPTAPIPPPKPPLPGSVPAAAAPPDPAAAGAAVAVAEETEDERPPITSTVNPQTAPLTSGENVAFSASGNPLLVNANGIPVPAGMAGMAAEAGSRMFGVQGGASRFQIRATQDSWVQVRDGNGELLLARVLRPGDVFRAPDRPGLKLRTGNAGGLTLIADGKELGPMGATGQVLRDIAVDPAARGAARSGTPALPQ